MTNVTRCHFAFDARVLLVAVGQKENVQQRSVDWRSEECRHALSLHLARRVDVGPRCTHHDFECRKWRGVMPLRLLLDHGRRGGAKKPELRVADVDRPTPRFAVLFVLAGRLLLANQSNRRCLQIVDRNDVAYQPHAKRFTRID